MTFKTALAADVSGVFLNTSEFADLVTYRAGGSGAGVSVRAIIDIQQDLSQGNPGQVAVGYAEVAEAEVLAPAVYDTLTTDAGVVWRVDQIIGGDGYTWKLAVSTDHRPGAAGV
jgi:hypothetical protein